MAYHWTGNLDEDLFQHFRDEDIAVSKLPVCDRCGEHITGDYWYECEPLEMFCEDCKNDWLHDHRHEVEEVE